MGRSVIEFGAKQNTPIVRDILFTNHDSVSKITTSTNFIEPLQRADIKVEKGLNEEQFAKLYSLLQRYRDYFATDLTEIGSAVDVEMTIELIDKKLIGRTDYYTLNVNRLEVRLTNYYRMALFRNRNLVTLVPFESLKRKPMNKHCVDFRALQNK